MFFYPAYFVGVSLFSPLFFKCTKTAFCNNCNFLKASSPACTELETIVMNWLGKMIGLPDEFLHTRSDAPGGGVIQVSKKKCRKI